MLKVSFILPCYNVAPYIGRCIESIEHQDIPQSEYEVICVDDCSKDNTVEVIKEYQAKYPNIQLICHEVNKTAGGARNTGMDAAKGEYLWLVDPDDCIEANVLETLIAKSEKCELDILLFNYILTEERGAIHHSKVHKTHDIVFTGVEYTLTQCAPRYLYDMAAHTCCLYNRAFLEKHHIRYPKIRSSQDVVFVWKAELLAQKVGAVEDACYHIIRRAESTTGSKGKLYAEAVISASLLYVHEIDKLRELNTEAILESILLKEMKLSVNDDSRKVLRTTFHEQLLFYKAICKYGKLCDKYRSLMDRKSKVIFNYHLPYLLWQAMILGYMIVEKSKV